MPSAPGLATQPPPTTPIAHPPAWLIGVPVSSQRWLANHMCSLSCTKAPARGGGYAHRAVVSTSLPSALPAAAMHY